MEYDFGQRDGRNVRNLRKLDVFEVSPVIVGAGVGTHTQLVKGSDRFGDEGERLILRALHAIRSGDEAAAQEAMLALQVHREELRARALGVSV